MENSLKYKRKCVADYLNAKLLSLRDKYRTYSGECRFLEEGGNIVDFNNWWEVNCNSSKWTYNLDAADAFVNYTRLFRHDSPTSVLVTKIGEDEALLYDMVSDNDTAYEITSTVEITLKDTHNSVIKNKDILVNNCNQNTNSFKDNNEVVEQILPMKRQKLMRKCIVENCSSNDEVVRHTFPAIITNGDIIKGNIDRLREWIKNCGNKDLLSIPSSKLHNKYFVCSAHFSNECYYNVSRKRLLPNAIPTLFENITKLSEIELKVYPIYTTEQLILDIPEENQMYDKFQKDFETYMENLNLRSCKNCKEVLLVANNISFKCIHGKNCKEMFSHSNNMDPGIVPDVLQNLTLIEQQLIAKIHTQISVHSVRGQQLKYSGNIINFPQDVSKFSRSLPHRLEDLPSIIMVRTANPVKPVDFRVRSAKIKAALLYLKHNNKFYSDIEISESNLLELPEDGNVFDRLKTIDNSKKANENRDIVTEDNSIIDEEINEAKLDSPNEETENEYSMVDTYVPSIQIPSQDTNLQNVFDWPTIDANPISEFTTEGYISQAFPCLFPTGAADLHDPVRPYKIKPIMYFRHLLRYHDQRFAQHATFRFFALNSIMRWTALNEGNVFIKKHSELADLNVEQLKKKVEENPKLIQQLVFQNKNVRGSTPYWKSRQRELTAMVDQLGLPTLFLTLSAADYHWPDLFRILSPNKDIQDLSERERQKLIKDNPIVVDSFFTARVEAIYEKVLIPKFNVKDYWYRVEYQHRGSPHIHGVLWLDNAPDITKVSDVNSVEAKEVCEYVDSLVSTFHPNDSLPPAVEHPCRKRLSQIEDHDQDIAELINKVQIHSQCNSSYCIRKKKVNGVVTESCRFGYPMELNEETKLEMDDQGQIEIILKRNHTRINNHNKYILSIWRANMDVKVIASKEKMIAYIAKYVTKGEIKSQDYNEMFQNIFMSCKDTDVARKFVQKLFIKVSTDRDFSAQEVGHNIMGLPYFKSGSRNFVHIYFNALSNKSVIYKNRGEKNIFEKYYERVGLHDKSLWEACKKYELPSSKLKQVQSIILTYPYKKEHLDMDENDDFYKYQVVLHVPHKKYEDLEKNFVSWKYLYEQHKILDKVQTGNELIELVKEHTKQLIEENDNDLNNDEELRNLRREEYMLVAEMGPDKICDEIDLGMRDIDLIHDWSVSHEFYKIYGSKQEIETFITRMKATHDRNDLINDEITGIQYTSSQQKVLDIFQSQIDFIEGKCNETNIPKRIIVQGKAGTGKSVIINEMRRKTIYLGKDSIMLLAPTGIAALNINGSTINSKLHINTRFSIKHLTGENGRRLENEMENVKFLIIDEYSMVGTKMLSYINMRCQQGKQDFNNDFGNLFVYLFGDIQQLPPPGDFAIYSPNKSNISVKEGQELFMNFDSIVQLNEVMRQSDVKFLEILNNISNGEITEDDYHSISKRFSNDEAVKYEKEQYTDEIHLFAEKKYVKIYNDDKLAKLKQINKNENEPIALIPGKHNCRTAESASEDDADGLCPKIILAKNAKIMLTSNLWTEKGLVNGAVGKVVDILYDTGKCAPEDTPYAIICCFDSYKGPYLENDLKTVPIPALHKSWTTRTGIHCTRSQFPLKLAYAMTIHKSQGLTLEKVYVNIGEKEFSLGLTYVALSRCKCLNKTIIDPFPLNRLAQINNSKQMEYRKKFWSEFLTLKLRV